MKLKKSNFGNLPLILLRVSYPPDFFLTILLEGDTDGDISGEEDDEEGGEMKGNLISSHIKESPEFFLVSMISTMAVSNPAKDSSYLATSLI